MRLAAIVRGRRGDEALAYDDELTSEDVRRLAGDHADAVLKAVSRRSGPERLLELSLRSGPYGDQFGLRPDGLNLDKVAAAPGGIDIGDLQPRLPELLRTPSGRIEAAPEVLLGDLRQALADVDAVAPEFVIIGRRDVRSNNSWMHNLPTLAKGPERCTLLVNPGDAQRLKLLDGALARIQRDGRAVVAPVELSDAMSPSVVSLPHGWGHDRSGAQLSLAAQRPGASLNDVLDDSLRDPLSGNAVLSGVGVTIEAAT
jgi:hypothetical protein